ncbi:hypothetical protein [Streptomyces sp. NPDC002403]
MTRKFEIAKFTAVGALVIGTSLLSAPQASANGGDTGVVVRLYDWSPNIHATGGFGSYGDQLTVCDTMADGNSAWAGLYKFVYNGKGTFIKSTSAGGNGNCSTNSANVAEGTVVWVKACVRRDGVNLRCKWSNSGYA